MYSRYMSYVQYTRKRQFGARNLCGTRQPATKSAGHPFATTITLCTYTAFHIWVTCMHIVNHVTMYMYVYMFATRIMHRNLELGIRIADNPHETISCCQFPVATMRNAHPLACVGKLLFENVLYHCIFHFSVVSHRIWVMCTNIYVYTIVQCVPVSTPS